MKTSSSTTRQLSKAARRTSEEVQEFVRKQPKRSIGGILALAALIGLGIWAWPELHRTIHIHRM